MGNNKKISDSNLRLLLWVAAIAILLLAFFLGYTNITKAAKTVEESNLLIKAQVDELRTKEAMLPIVREETASYQERIDAIIEKYPSLVTEEKEIAILQELEDATTAHFSSITFNMENFVTAIPTAANVSTVAEEGEGEVEEVAPVVSSVNGYLASSTIAYQADYDSLKMLIEEIHKYPDRMNVSKISCAYDSDTGLMSGSMTLNMYYITGTDKEYVAPTFEGIDKGVGNIFSSNPAISNGDAAGSDEGEDAEAENANADTTVEE